MIICLDNMFSGSGPGPAAGEDVFDIVTRVKLFRQVSRSGYAARRINDARPAGREGVK
jgi:hypothetical protein